MKADAAVSERPPYLGDYSRNLPATPEFPSVARAMLDLRFAVRQLLKSPGFSIVAILSLALGIGANTALFSLVNEVALKSLPVKAPDELVLFRWLSDSPGMMRSTWGWGSTDPKTKLRTSTSFSKLTYERIRDLNQSLVTTFAFTPLYNTTIIVDNVSEVTPRTEAVSGTFFSALGVTPVIGRMVAVADDLPGATPVAILSHHYWSQRFQRNPNVLGKTLLMNRVAFTIVGVTPEAYQGVEQIGENPDISVPLIFADRVMADASELAQPWCWWLRIMGRLKPGVTRDQAAAETEPIFRQSARDGYEVFPKSRISSGEKPPVEPLLRAGPGGQGLVEQREKMASTLSLLAGLVVLVLAIACTNVANLLLARGAARQREMAVRLALGASRWRIIRQLLIESLLLSSVGALLGIAFATWGTQLLLALRPFGFGTVIELSLDWRVLGFTAGVAVLTGIVFGLAPALRTTGVDVNAGLQSAGKQGGSGRRPWLPPTLMVVQVGLSLVLLVGAGLFLRTLQRLREVDVGFNRNHLLLFRIDAASAGYAKEKYVDLYERIAARIRLLPGVQAVTFAHVSPLTNSANSSSVVIEGRPPPTGKSPSPYFNRVDPEFFATFQIPLLFGRALTERDESGGTRVALINQTMARTFFEEENPVGRTFRQGRLPNDPVIQVVGVVRDAFYSDLRSKIPATVYLPMRQDPTSLAAFIVRVPGDPATIATDIRRIVREIDATIPVANLRTQDEQIDRILASEILFARLSSFFGMVALVLACIGLYGLVSYGVARRTTEIGIRMALGALPANVRSMILRESLGLVGLGIVLGIAGAFAATKALSSLLYDLSPRDPRVYAATSLLLLAVALVACWLPARRASRTDPMVALRSE